MNTTHAFELLRRADPVSTLEQQRVAEHVARRFDRVRSTVAAVAPERAQPRRRRRLVAVAAVVLVAALVAVPALGLGVPGIDFFGAEKAPPKAVELFESLSVGAPPGMDPQAIAGEARKLATTTAAGEKRTVWVAPTRAGGLCYLWVGAGGGCDRLGTTPLGVSWWSNDRPLIRTGRDGLALPPEPGDFSGITVHASARYVERVQIHFADGAVVEPAIAWVSEPIGHGFFLYRFTRAQRLAGHEVAAVVALDESGDVVTEEAVCCESGWAMPDDAIESERRSAVTIDTVSGPAVVWTAPTRYDGTCAWLEIGDDARPLHRCLPMGYDREEALSVGLHPTKETVLVFGRASDRHGQLDLHYADGAVEPVELTGRYFLVEIPQEHLQERSRLLTTTVRDRAGREIPSGPRVSYPARGTAADSCFRVLPLHAGESCP